MHYFIGLCIVVALIFGGLFMVNQVQENHLKVIKAETAQEHTRAMDRAHIITTQAQANTTNALALNSQIQTFSIAMAGASNQAMSWAILLLVTGSIVGLVIVILSRQRLVAESKPQQLIVEKPIYILPEPRNPAFLNALSAPSYIEIEARHLEEIPARTGK